MNKYNKKVFAFVTVLSIPCLLFSNDILSRISGEVGLEYDSNSIKGDDKNNKSSTISEYVHLGYKDFIYSPRLLDYSLQTKFSLKDTNNEDNDQETATSNTVNEYDVQLNFLKDSRYPMNFDASKNSNPSTQVTSDGVLETTYEQDTYGINGAVYLNNKLTIDYLINTSEKNSQNSDGIDKVNGNNYKIGFNKAFKDFSVKTSFDNAVSTRDINYDDLNSEEDVKNHINTGVTFKDIAVDIDYTKSETTNSVDTSSDEIINDIATTFDWDYSKTIKFNNNFNTTEDESDGTSNMSEYFTLRWNPNADYSLSSSSFYNKYEELTDTITTMGESLNSSYNISEKLSTSQTASYYTLDSESNETEDLNFSSILSYITPIGEMSTLNLNGGITGLLASGTDEDANGNTYTYNLTAGVLNRFEKTNSRLFYDVNYYQSFSDISDEEQKIRLSSVFDTKLILNLDYTADVDYTYRTTYSLDGTQGDIENKVLNAFTGFTTHKNLDVRGLINGKFGLKYSKIERTDNETIVNLNPTADISLRFRLWRTMVYTGTFNAYQDTLYDTQNYGFSNKLLYRYRKLTVELSADFNEQTSGESGDVSTSNFKFLFKRSL